jgi:hypothetical protein
VVFIEAQSFTARLASLAGSSAMNVLEAIQSLMENPQRGSVVRGLGGIRKARVANPARGKGTRGGFRYLYLYLERRGHIHLIFLLDKNEQEDLDSKERAILKGIAAAVRAG